MPADLYAQRASLGKWKESIREKINKRFEIIGNIGDTATDFAGEYNSRFFKLPNRLY